MRDGADQKRLTVTLSWDDGHPLDLRLAEVLQRYGVSATFYVPLRNTERSVLPASGFRRLAEMDMELGAHTYNHRVLTGLPRQLVRQEVVDGKRALEDILGGSVRCFCYPKGKFNRLAREEVGRAGFALGRTTVAFRTGWRFDPLLMPVSLQLMSHTRLVHIRHAVKEWNISGLWRYLVSFRHAQSLEQLVDAVADQAASKGEVIHLWGHSWELEKQCLWPMFEELLQNLTARPDVRFLSNSEVLEHARRRYEDFRSVPRANT